ncbi:MAG TPA: minichromosome maintenance protein MCM, partial [Nitrososphaerales archaeon]|nr:minichromosome maintenance protein MCM [Nitrososphaerales archaeon]
LPDGSTLRGDVNVLLVGDPGTAKSELLKYVSRVAPRALYTSGRGTTAAGLTAAVVREKNGMMMLEAGATVLADLGVAVIDEFDKMRKEDRDALHEVMEQQSASVAKGGFIATLNARTSILAAANPIFGKYDSYKNILDNINLPVPLLTRFDLVFIVKDEPDAARDQILAKDVLDLHAKLSFPRAPPIAFDLLKKYIAYAKKLDPELTEEARKRLSDYYVQLRKMAQPGQIAVTPRWLEGLIRLSIARARILLHPRVTDDDALRAVNLMKRMLETVAVDQNTKQVDPGVLYGKPLSERGLLETALETFKQLEGTGQTKEAVKDADYISALVKTGKFSEDEADKMLKTLYRSGQIYETKPHYYRKI